MINEYKVALDIYNGPLDLLLFLIKRDEIDIYDIPIARITEQYVEYVRLLQQIDPEVVSEFLVLAATLIEIKSRTLLPSPPPEEVSEDFVDPRRELVRQLLEYKRFKDAARGLDHAATIRAMKAARSPAMPERDANEFDLQTVDIWDLFEAFNRLLQQTGKLAATHHVGVDDTPLALHAEDVLDSIQRAGGSQDFSEIFAGRTRPEMIGLFLALLELIRQRRINAVQERPFAPIRICLIDATPLDAFDEEKVFGAGAPGDDEPAPFHHAHHGGTENEQSEISDFRSENKVDALDKETESVDLGIELPDLAATEAKIEAYLKEQRDAE
ncbi:MAG: segregation/condensation protein A [Planctomycetes bacterium]|nr:segregation/condensation protein A [Planctomycetota bacterium]MBI3834386.1 segregation/condensation protein A [Planctomycetota bacterium]